MLRSRSLDACEILVANEGSGEGALSMAEGKDTEAELGELWIPAAKS